MSKQRTQVGLLAWEYMDQWGNNLRWWSKTDEGVIDGDYFEYVEAAIADDLLSALLGMIDDLDSCNRLGGDAALASARAAVARATGAK
jgi:hypothetical protein